MAKMFYNLKETAEVLGKSEEEVKEMAASGMLKQFRDREQIMFKRDEVDSLAGGANDDSGINLDDDLALDSGGSTGSTPALADDDQISLSDSGAIPLAGDPNATDELSLDDEPAPRKEDARQATGISVFDADELEDPADPMAQTQVTGAATVDEEELALESVGSGSGLLDLTRESDDTSLGAELLDEIYPSEGPKGGADNMGGTATAADTFDPTTLDLSDTTPTGLANLPQASGLENLQGGNLGFEGVPADAALGEGIMAPVAINVADPGSDALGLFTLMPATGVLVAGMFMAVSAVIGTSSDPVTSGLAGLGDKLTIVAIATMVAIPALGLVAMKLLNRR